MRMKRFAYLSVIFFPGLVFSLYTGSPSTTDMIEKGLVIEDDFWLGVKVIYEGDILLDKSLKPTNKTTTPNLRNTWQTATMCVQARRVFSIAFFTYIFTHIFSVKSLLNLYIFHQ